MRLSVQIIYASLASLLFLCLHTTVTAKELTYGVYSIPANSNKPGEDAYAVDDRYFGVFDGHKGNFVAQYLAKNLLPLIKAKTEDLTLAKDIKRKIAKAFAKIDNDMRLDPKTPPLCGAPGAVVFEQNEDIYVAHVGSTRVFVLTQKNNRFSKSRNHTVNDPRETDRIKRERGTIRTGKTSEKVIVDDCSENICKIHKRASRSFGDFYLNGKNVLTKPLGLSVMPDIKKFHRKNIRAIFIVTDGIWRSYGDNDNELKPLEELFRKLLKSRMSPQKMAETIVKTVREKVLEEKQKMDDMTALVITYS